LDADGAEVTLSGLVDGGERFKSVRIVDDDYVVLIDKQHSAAGDAELTAERLAEIPHVVITAGGDDTDFIGQALDECGLAPKVAVHVPFLSVPLLLVGSHRLAIVPRRAANNLALVCPLVVMELLVASPPIELSMIWRRRLDHPAHRWLRSMVRVSMKDR
jgi:DNA-binding transcriptional LysR family regulator